MNVGAKHLPEHHSISVVASSARKEPVEQEPFRVTGTVVVRVTAGAKCQKSIRGRLAPRMGSFHPGPTDDTGVMAALFRGIVPNMPR